LQKRNDEWELGPIAHYLDIIGFISIDITHANRRAHDMCRDMVLIKMSFSPVVLSCLFLPRVNSIENQTDVICLFSIWCTMSGINLQHGRLGSH
jgi:hypothetical protein